MIVALKGTITRLQPDHLWIDVQGITYRVLIARSQPFTLGSIHHVLTLQIFREDDQYLVGFASEDDRFMFERLISVKGIGPKTALAALSGTVSSEIVKAINVGNVSFLKSLPGIGPKAASQIVLDLRGKLVEDPDKKIPLTPIFDEAKEALKALGFKPKEVDDALKFISPEEQSVQTIIRLALKRLGKA
jgi:Holliday junction DNA helicase RuvA